MKKLFIIAIAGAVAFSAVNASAASGLRSIGFGAGYASPENIDGTWTVALNFDFGLPVTNLYVQPFVGYWTKGFDVDGGSLGSIESDFSDWMFGGNVKYVIPTSAPNLRPYVQAGLAAHMLKAETTSNFLGEPISLSATDTKVGVQGGAGLAFDINERWGLFGQGTYHMVSDFNQWMVGGGVQVNL
jgi:opacity protein-like surface antigen